MKEDPFAGVYRALSPKELAEMFMNPHAPKTEPEHWAVREIETLRAEVERLREVIRTIRARCVEMDDSDAVSETLDISSAALEDEP